MTLRARMLTVVACLTFVSSIALGQNTFAGLNTVQNKINASAAPDVTIAVGTLQYCEHANSGYQCWWKSNNQPVKFLGNTNVKSDASPWTQNSNNSGNTTHCGTAFTPNSQLMHDNVYNLWILEKRITAAGGGHNYMCVAISNGEDISNSSFTWFAMEYDLDTVIPKNSHGNFYYPDYPQAGLWQSSTSTVPPYTAAKDQAMWITYDLQDVNASNNINGILVCAVDLAGLRNSTANPWVNNSKTPACAVAHTLTSFNQRRSWVPANNSDTTPPISNDGEMFTYMIEPPKDNITYRTDPLHTQGVEQWTIDWTAATPTPAFVNSWDLPSTMSGGDQVGCFTAANYYNTVCIPQPSTASTNIYIDSVADRMQQFFHYTSNGGQGSVWTSAHALQITPGTTLSQTEADIRMLQRDTLAPNPVYITADYQITDPADGSAYVFLPSIARDKAGNLQGIIGISGTGVDEHPGLDSVNINPGTQIAASDGYIASPLTDGDSEDTDTLNYRWGDWQSAVLDPSDGCTIWVAGEYLPQNRTTEPYWYTEMASLPPASTCAGGPVLLSSVSLNFGSQQMNQQSAPIVVTLTNNQGVGLNISTLSSNLSDFTATRNCQNPIPAGGTCAINVYFTPLTAGMRKATLTITDDAPNSPQTIALTGMGVNSSITVAPTSLSFGAQVINTTSAGQKITVTNSGFGTVSINSIQASGGFTETDTCAGQVLNAGQNCTITASFSPVVSGGYSGTITINDAASGAPHIATMTGTSQWPVTFSANLSFPATNVGSSSASQTMTLTNNQTSTLNFTWSTSGDYSAVGNGTNPCNGTLAAKAKCTFAVTFTPTQNGQIKGALTISYSGAGSPAAGGFTGTGQNGATAPLTFTPANLSYGNVVLKATASKTVTVKNTSATTINISSVTGSGPYVATPSGATPCSGALNAGSSCTFTATFTPLVTGSIIGNVTVSDNGSVSTQVQNATGTGVVAVTLSPSSLSFGSVSVGTTSAVQVVTITNNQTTAVPINSVVASGDFIYTTGGGVPCGTSIPANSICTLGVEFSPTIKGAISGDLTLSYPAGSSPQAVALSGTGQ